MKLGVGSIIALILAIVFLTVLLSVAESVIPTGAKAYHSLATGFGGNSTTYGSGASTFATNSINYMGWFWVLGPFVLTIVAVVGLFLNRGRM